MNWTPIDLTISRSTPSDYIRLLQAMAECGMNTVRVWGGGYYENEVFYDTCDRLGIMIWHDLMFAGTIYRADDEFLENVKWELKYQILRLKSHPSIVLWSGGACTLEELTTFPGTEHDIPRFLMDFTKLNQVVIKETLNFLDPSRLFWPSSPSAGPDDFSKDAMNEEFGDMHFWNACNSSTPFTSYRKARPRFVSEVGYPSYPTLSTLAKYTSESERNISAPAFEERQMMKDANSIILQNLASTFRFPTSFENMLYLSQAQQALWTADAIKYWRSMRPYCMGTLFWNLASMYPSSDTAAIEYGGKRKAVMYASKSFFAPIIPIGVIDGNKLHVYATNDTDSEIEVKVSIKFASFHGEKLRQMVYRKVLSPDSVTPIATTDISQIKASKNFCYLKVSTPDLYRETTIFLDAPKRCELEDPSLKVNVTKSGHNFNIEVSCKRPAFGVLLDAGDANGFFTENFFAIRPTAQLVSTFINEGDVSEEEFKAKLKIYDMYCASYK